MPKQKKTSFARRALRWSLRIGAGCIAASVLAVLFLRWVPPLTSAVIVQKTLAAVWTDDERFRLRHQWVSWEEISGHAKIAVIASEDQRFPDHHGFDFHALGQALRSYRDGGRLRGASTISQQVAKNLFLWSGRSFVRKGLEAYFTGLIELLWPKERILEVYLNIAEFGPGIFGIEAASQAYFRKPAARLSAREAALLAAVLPNPLRLRADRPSAYVLDRRNWILHQMWRLGGPDYLKRLS